MDTDDPWGSPWADEIHPPDPLILETKQKEAAVKRPKTPVNATSLALQKQTKSPWDDADDNGFGEWATVPTEEGSRLDGADDRWDGSLAPKIPSTKETSGALSSTWSDLSIIPGEVALKLAPSPLPRPSDPMRLPSPDPWTLEHTEKRVADNADSKESELQIQSEKPDTLENAEPESQIAQIRDSPSELVPGTDDVLEKLTADALEDSKEALDVVEKAECAVELEPKHEQASNSHESENVSSRPSSPSERSHHEDVLPESPRTSLDEAPTRPSIPRKVSSKVQVLVEHFDTLAKKDEMDEVIGGTTKVAEAPKEDEGADEEANGDTDDDFGDFGDFEEGQPEVGDPIIEKGPLETSKSAEVMDYPSQKATNSLDDATLPMPTPKKDYGPIEFVPDTSTLGKLYPDLEQIPAESCFIPDTVPHDSFSSTEERKTWYRVSRYGSARKHNFGDDENYARVNWTKSEVRTDTLKIVARWIEEDRISGRVVLGGGSKAGSIFGWNDQKAVPGSISATLATKTSKKKTEAGPIDPAVEVPREWPKGLVRTRSTSKGRSSSKPRRQSSVKSSKGPEEAKIEPAPAANFGWSTVSENPKEPVRTPPSSKRSSVIISNKSSPAAKPSTPIQRRLSSRASSITSIFKNKEPVQQKPTPVAPPSITIPPTAEKPTVPPTAPSTALTQLSNDDDEWGEMVSSPATTTAPVLPLTNRLRHKKSRSFGRIFPTTQPAAPSMNMQTLPKEPVRGHRPTVSFDEILIPETWGPATTSTPINPNPFSVDLSGVFMSPAQQSTETKTLPAPAANSDLFSMDLNNAFMNPVQQVATTAKPPAPVDNSSLFSMDLNSAFMSPVQQASETATPIATTGNSSLFSVDRNSASTTVADQSVKPAPASASNYDPWASVDFSFFDTPSAPTAKLAAKPTLVPSPLSKQLPTKAASFTSTRAPAAALAGHRKSKEIEQDRIVQNVIKGLPDLSYMFKR